jgi:hypothetical protein
MGAPDIRNKRLANKAASPGCMLAKGVPVTDAAISLMLLLLLLLLIEG